MYTFLLVLVTLPSSGMRLAQNHCDANLPSTWVGQSLIQRLTLSHRNGEILYSLRLSNNFTGRERRNICEIQCPMSGKVCKILIVKNIGIKFSRLHAYKLGAKGQRAKECRYVKIWRRRVGRAPTAILAYIRCA